MITPPPNHRFQGDGSWFSIELPVAEAMSGIKLWFEDSNERRQSFTTVCVGEGEVSEVHLPDNACTPCLIVSPVYSSIGFFFVACWEGMAPVCERTICGK